MAILNTRTYKQDSVNPDSVTYTGPSHTFSSKDELQLSRIRPKAGRNGDLGVARPEMKLTRSVVVNPVTGEKKDMILKCPASLPVGSSAADIEALLADAASFFGSDNAKALYKALDVYAE